MEIEHAQFAEARIGIGEAARLAQLHPDTLRRAVKRGALPFTRTPGGLYRFRRSDVEALLSGERAS